MRHTAVKGKTIRLRVDPSLKASIEAAAGEAGVSEWLRQLAKEAIHGLKVQERWTESDRNAPKPRSAKELQSSATAVEST